MSNRPRWSPGRSPFYEVWYVIFAEPTSGDGFWIRYTLLNPGDDHPQAGAALWFAYTCRSDPSRHLSLTHTFSADALSTAADPPRIEIGDAALADGMLRGQLDADGHRVAWDLWYTPPPEPHYYFGQWFRRLTASRASVTVPGPSILLRGHVTIDGREIIVRSAPGHQAHHWGSQRARHWLWAHCVGFTEDAEAVAEMLAPEIAPGLVPAFVTLRTHDRSYECTGVTDLLWNRAAAGLGFWQFQGRSGNAWLTVDVTVDPRLVSQFTYTSPTYRTSQCWNTQIGDCLVRVYDQPGLFAPMRLARVLRARGTAAAEIHDERPAMIPYTSWATPLGGTP